MFLNKSCAFNLTYCTDVVCDVQYDTRERVKLINCVVRDG